MHLPLEIDFGQVPPSAALKNAVRAGAAHLNRYCPDVIGCAVSLSGAGTPAAAVRVHIRLSLPGATVEVHHAQDPHEDLEAAIHGAFDAIHLRLEDWLAARRTTAAP